MTAGSTNQQTTKGLSAVDSLASLRQPINGLIYLGISLGSLGALSTLVPFIGLAQLGQLMFSESLSDNHTLMYLGVLVAIGLMLGWACNGAALWIMHVADHKLQTALRRALVRRLAKVPLGWYSDKNSGAVKKAVQDDLEDLHHLVAHHYVELFSAIVLPIGGLLYLLWLDWRLALLATLTWPVYALAYIWMMRGFSSKMTQLDQSFAKVSAAIIEFVQGIAVVKVFGQSGRAHARYQQAVAEFSTRYAGWVRPLLRLQALTSMALSVPMIALVSLLLGSWMVQQGWISASMLVAELLIAMAMPQTLMALTQGLAAQQKAQAAALRVAQLLEADDLPMPTSAQVPAGADICFDQVSFRFNDKANVLQDINLVCQAGTVTALVGPSGAGKSTLAKLVPRFYDVTQGAIRLGGVDVRDMAPEVLYRHVGFVLQEAQLLRATVRDNLRLGQPNATEQEVERVAQLAHIHERIMALPRGYDSIIGEDAIFSGGEAQRLSIARTLLADTPIIILDEATAHADPESEAQVQQALSAVTKGRTVLVIAHRLSTITQVDQILVLDQGQIKERGSHQALLKAQGLYQRMWQTCNEMPPEQEGLSPLNKEAI